MEAFLRRGTCLSDSSDLASRLTSEHQLRLVRASMNMFRIRDAKYRKQHKPRECERVSTLSILAGLQRVVQDSRRTVTAASPRSQLEHVPRRLL